MSATKPALPEPVAWLHDVVATDGGPDHALSFAPDNFPLQGVGGFRSIGCQPLYTQAAIDAAVADYAQALSSALGWPGGISDPVLDWPTLLRYVAEARAVPADWADQIEHRLLTWRQRTMNRSGDRLDERGIGEPGVTCGDCPRDYGHRVAAHPAPVERVALTDKLIDAATIRHWGRRSAPALADHRGYARAVIAEYERINGVGTSAEVCRASQVGPDKWLCDCGGPPCTQVRVG